jgi:hypothetical protein
MLNHKDDEAFQRFLKNSLDEIYVNFLLNGLRMSKLICDMTDEEIIEYRNMSVDPE